MSELFETDIRENIRVKEKKRFTILTRWKVVGCGDDHVT
jgi:hypothetical protein